MNQSSPDSADREFGDSLFFEFTDSVIPLPPGTRARHRSADSVAETSTSQESPEVRRRREQRFRDVSDAELLLLWGGSERDNALREAVLAEAKRRVADRECQPMSPALSEILNGRAEPT